MLLSPGTGAAEAASGGWCLQLERDTEGIQQRAHPGRLRLCVKESFAHQAGGAVLGEVPREAGQSVWEGFKAQLDESMPEGICVTDGPLLGMKLG